jgi:hypothetical protein
MAATKKKNHFLKKEGLVENVGCDFGGRSAL